MTGELHDYFGGMHDLRQGVTIALPSFEHPGNIPNCTPPERTG
jgi:hypothetical protein